MKKLIASLLAIGAAGLLSAQEGVHFAIGARGNFGFGLGSSTNVAENYALSLYDAQWDSWVDQAKANGYAIGTKQDLDIPWDDTNLSVKPFQSFLAGGALVGRISFDSVPGLYIQPEIGFSHNQVKYTYSWEYSKDKRTTTYKYHYDYEAEGDGSMSYSSIDIPILAGYDVELGHGMVVSPYGGLNLSIPIGKVSWTDGASTQTRTGTYNYLDASGNVTGSRSADQINQTTKTNSSSIDSKITNGVIPGLILGTGFGYKFDDHNMIFGDLRYLLDFIAVKGETDLKEATRKSAKETGTSFSWDADDEKYNEDFRFDTFTRRALTFGISYYYFF